MLKAGPIERGRKEKVDRDSKVKKQKEKKGRSPRMIQYVFATFRQVWNHARQDGLVTGEWPVKEIKFPKIENRRMRFLSNAESDALLEDLKVRSQQLHDISLLSLDIGMRAKEIFTLQWGRVDLKRELIRVVDSKGRDRSVSMTSRVKNMFLRLPKGKKKDLVFLNRKGGCITEIWNSFDRAVKSLGLNDDIEDPRDKLVFHSLRHSFASRLVESGVDLHTVKELMGHSSISMTERYAHLHPDTLKAAIKKMEDARKKEKEQDKVVELRKAKEAHDTDRDQH